MSVPLLLRWFDARPDTGPDAGKLIEVSFRLLGWLAVSLLAAAGLFVAVFAAFGNFTLDGFFLHLANIANRYGSADAARRAAFGETLLLVGGAVLGAAMFLRRASLVQIFVKREKD